MAQSLERLASVDRVAYVLIEAAVLVALIPVGLVKDSVIDLAAHYSLLLLLAVERHRESVRCQVRRELLVGLLMMPVIQETCLVDRK